MTFNEKLFELLTTTRRYYKGVPVNVFGMPTFFSFKSNTIRGSIHRLKKDGLIVENGDLILLTDKGREYANKKYLNLKNFSSDYKKDSPKNLIVMYDIPEEKKKERNWFRFHLKKFGYQMIQRSVWVGPSPLPKEFLAYVDSIKLKENLQTFKLAKPFAFKNKIDK